MTVRLYSWNDPGAPILANTPGSLGSLINLLKKCLVEGYGTKPGAGWTMPFEDAVNNKAAFRNGLVEGGTGTYFYIDDNVDYRYAHIRGYRSMSDINTGAYPFPHPSRWNGSPGAIIKCYSNAVNNGGLWYVIACERGAYIITKGRNSDDGYNPYATKYNGQWYVYFIGDALSYVPGDPYCGMLNVSYGGDMANFIVGSMLYAGPRGWENYGCIVADEANIPMASDHFGIRHYVGAGCFGNAALDITTAQSRMGFGKNGPPAPNAFGGLHLSKIFLSHTDVVRGEMPGVIYPCYQALDWVFFKDAPNTGFFKDQKWFLCYSNAFYNNIASGGFAGAIRYDCPTSEWYTIK